MPLWRAILLFPLRPGRASDALKPRAALAAPAPPLFLFALLAARGCRPADAAVTAAGLLLLVLGLAFGGAVASRFARRLLPGAPRRGLHVHLLFASWTVAILLLGLFLTGSALWTGLVLLVWGVAAGTAVLAGAAEIEPGRLLVTSCAGAFGALLGLILMGYVVHGRMVRAMPAPGETGGTLLVRIGEASEPHALVLAVDPVSATLFLARREPGGLVPEGKPPPGPPSSYETLGRVFFFFGVGNRLGTPFPE